MGDSRIEASFPIEVLEDSEAVARHAANSLARLVKLIGQKGERARVALSGGSTPTLDF